MEEAANLEFAHQNARAPLADALKQREDFGEVAVVENGRMVEVHVPKMACTYQ